MSEFVLGEEALVREIENRKIKELEALDSELAAKKEELLRDKNARLQEINERYRREAQLRSEREAIKIVEAARLQGRRIIFHATDAYFNSAFNIIREELKNYTKTLQHKKTLEGMIKIAKERFGEGITIHCREEDRKILKDIGATVNKNSIHTLGGLVIENKEGTMELDFTFEELLRTHEEEIRVILLGKG